MLAQLLCCLLTSVTGSPTAQDAGDPPAKPAPAQQTVRVRKGSLLIPFPNRRWGIPVYSPVPQAPLLWLLPEGQQVTKDTVVLRLDPAGLIKQQKDLHRQQLELPGLIRKALDDHIQLEQKEREQRFTLEAKQNGLQVQYKNFLINFVQEKIKQLNNRLETSTRQYCNKEIEYKKQKKKLADHFTHHHGTDRHARNQLQKKIRDLQLELDEKLHPAWLAIVKERMNFLRFVLPPEKKRWKDKLVKAWQAIEQAETRFLQDRGARKQSLKKLKAQPPELEAKLASCMRDLKRMDVQTSGPGWVIHAVKMPAKVGKVYPAGQALIYVSPDPPLLELKGVLLIPRTALIQRKDKRFVRIRGSQGPEERAVTVSHLTEEFAVVKAGLAEGEEVFLR